MTTPRLSWSDRLLLRVLAAWLPPSDRAPIVGDFLESHAAQVAMVGPARAASWLRREIWRLLVRLLAARNSPGPPRHRPRRPNRTPLLSGLLEDVHHGFRFLARAPGFATVTTLTLALAVGANTAIFSVADAVLFRPLPYDEPDRVFILQMMVLRTGQRYTMTRYAYLRALSEQQRTIRGVGMLERMSGATMDGPDGPQSVPVVAVTPNYFDLLGVRPVRGRLFESGDLAGPGRPALMTHAAWLQRFGADEGIIGRSVALGAFTVDVVGVLPAGFVFPSLFAGAPEFVTLLDPVPAAATGGTVHPIVRLAPGATREQAQAEAEAIVASVAAGDPEAAGSTIILDDVRSVLYLYGRPIMALLLAAATLVLLVGCANLASMLMARGRAGARDIAVRTALGASRIRLVRPVVFAAVSVGAIGGALAALATSLVFEALVRQVPRLAYGQARVGVDLRVVAFAVVLGVLGGLVFAVVPAWRTTRLDVQAVIQGRQRRGSRRRSRLGRPMVAAQVALAIVLVFGAIVAGRAFVSVLQTPLGFAPDRVLMIRVKPRGLRGQALQAFYARAVENLAARADVIAAGAAGPLPLDGAAPNWWVTMSGSSERLAGVVHALPGFFEAAGIAVTRGRSFDWRDLRSGEDVAVVSESAGRLLFPGRDPVNATFDAGRGRRFTVVGVVADVRQSLDREYPGLAYVIPREETGVLTLLVRARTRHDGVVSEIRRDVARLSPGAQVRTSWWADQVGALTVFSTTRFQTLVLGSFATLAIGLTALGVFGLVAFLVATRTHEMGVRLAIGATPRELIGFMVGQALRPVGIGLVLGLLAAYLAGRLAAARLYRIEVGDPMALAAAALTVVAAAVVASYLPARRAGRVDPMAALRYE